MYLGNWALCSCVKCISKKCKKLSICALKLCYCHCFMMILLLAFAAIVADFVIDPCKIKHEYVHFIKNQYRRMNSTVILLFCSLNKWINQWSTHKQNICTYTCMLYVQCETTNQFHYSLIIFFVDRIISLEYSN